MALMIPIRNEYLPVGHPNRPGTKLDGGDPIAIVVHYTNNDAPNATDTMNAKYFARPYKIGTDGKVYESDGITPFAYGSAQVIIDEDSVSYTMDLSEVAWGCGDRRLPYDDLNKGQQPAARLIFGNRQNNKTLNVEICNNANWDKAVQDAIDWIVLYVRGNLKKIDVEASLDPNNYVSTKPGCILLLLHFDITGKICPKPFVDDRNAWVAFVHYVANEVNN